MLQWGWRSYGYRPVSALVSPDQTRQFVGRLRRALRAAHGLGIPLRMRWSSGDSGGVVLGVSSPVGERWLHFGLSSAYEMGQWHAAGDWHGLAQSRPEFRVTQGGAAEQPFPAPPDEPPWSETVLGQLRMSRAGVAVEWELVPDLGFPSREKWLPEWGEPLAKDERARTLPERILKDREEARRTGLRWRVSGRILIDARRKADDAGSQVAHLLEAASHLEGGNRFACRSAGSPLARLGRDAVLTEAELVGLFPPPTPIAVTAAHGSDRARLWVGRDLGGSFVGLPVESEQGRHLLVLGETGMGKSSLIVRLAWQAAQWGSVILFDPVGDTAREFLSGVPDTRSPQVSWVSPAVPGLTLNLLHQVASQRSDGAAHRERLLGDIVAALRRVRAGQYAESSFWGPRLEEMLLQALRAAGQWPGSSLALAERLLSPEGFPRRTVPDSAREAVDEIRRRIERAPQDGDGARRLLGEITRSPVLTEMLDARSPTWSVGAAVTPGRITVISGDAPQVGEPAARYLLAVVLALVWNEALVRARQTKVFLVLDEAQWYAHEGVAEMLRLGRRFNLHVWSVTQSLRSLPEPVRDAVTTNSADVVLFRGDPFDARDISRWVPQVTAEHLLRLPRGEAAILIDKGAETHWVQLSRPVHGRRDPNLFRPTVATDVGAGDEPVPVVNDESVRATSPIPNGPSRPDAATPVMEALTEWVERSGDRAELTVHLPDLRARWSVDPRTAESWVRSGGRFLASAGALIRNGKDDAGSFWVLSRKRLAEMLPAKRGIPGSDATGGRLGNPATERAQDEAS